MVELLSEEEGDQEYPTPPDAFRDVAFPAHVVVSFDVRMLGSDITITFTVSAFEQKFASVATSV